MSTKEKRYKQILSISGGGVRGLYPITVLADLEQSLADTHGDDNYSIAKHFDMICGTSIGGILALGLASGLTARELFSLLDNNRKSIFPKRWFDKVRKLTSTSYDPAPLKRVLVEAFGEKTMGDLITPVLIPAINYTKGGLQVFKTPHHPDFKRDWRLKLVDVALATSAAPTYFPVHKINDAWYVDGGLVVNSPSYLAVHEYRHFFNIDAHDLRVMMVGTMGSQPTADQSRPPKSGYAKGWAIGSRLIDLAMGASEGLHNQLTQHNLPDNNTLIVDDLPTAEQSKNVALDDASDPAAEVLRAKGHIKSQAVENEPLYNLIAGQNSPSPVFYYGPNKNNSQVQKQ